MHGAREIAVGAKVEGTDGEIGRLTDVIVNPLQRRVTHVVVEVDGGTGAFLVPVERIAGSTREAVRLSCSRAEVGQLPEFYTTRFVPATSPEAQPVLQAWQAQEAQASLAFNPGYPAYYEPYVLPDGDVPVTDERVPPGEKAFFRGTRVESSDGKDVGTVEEFILSPKDETITHFVVREGHLATAREVALPLSAVASATGETVKLRLSREEVERLPGVPVRRHYEWTSQSPGTLELVAIVYAAPEGAARALREVKGLVANQRLPEVDAAVLSKRADGRVSSSQEHDVTAGRGALVGAVVGGLLTLVAGPVGPIAGAAVGGAIGGAGAGMVDRGVPDRYLRDLGRDLKPGTSALVVLVHPAAVNALVEALGPLGGTVVRQLLTDEMVSQLTGPGAQSTGSPP
jgi:uncharacterized membrane protein/sporulation protein YlmC with PRC-barrel domain